MANPASQPASQPANQPDNQLGQARSMGLPAKPGGACDLCLEHRGFLPVVHGELHSLPCPGFALVAPGLHLHLPTPGRTWQHLAGSMQVLPGVGKCKCNPGATRANQGRAKPDISQTSIHHAPSKRAFASRHRRDCCPARSGACSRCSQTFWDRH